MIDKLYTTLSIPINNIAKDFIRPFKFPIKGFIFFNQKPDESLKLCVNYRGLHNQTIKTRYPLSLVVKLLDRLN